MSDEEPKKGVIKKFQGALGASISVVKSVGPFLLSQSEKTSDAYARHQLKMANVEAVKVLLLEEAKSIADVRDTLRKKYVDADPEERIRIRRDLREAEGDVKQLNIAAGAIDYLPEFASRIKQNEDKSETVGDVHPVSEHWFDRFNHFARQSNEPWRQDLLSRALAMQATNPESVTLRVIWLIGTLEKSTFDYFTTILDVSSQFKVQTSTTNTVLRFSEEGFAILGDSVVDRHVPVADARFEGGELNVEIGELCYEIEDSGLLADQTNKIFLNPNSYMLVRYRTSRPYKIRNISGAEIMFECVMPSVSGSCIATFYEARRTDKGKRFFGDWIRSLFADPKKRCEVTMLDESQ